MRKRMFVAVFGFGMMAASAQGQKADKPMAAETPAVRPKFIKICKAEATKLCANVEAGDGRIAQCLAEHSGDIGKPCRAALRRAKRVATFRAECGADVEKLCPDVKPGAGSIHQCLKANEATVSATCKTRLAKGNNRKAVADAAGLADEAVTEEQQGIETLPETLVVEEEATPGAKAVTEEKTP